MSKRSALTILVAILLLGVAIRAYHVTARSLWFDEAFSWRLVQFDIPELLTRDAADVHPPLYYIFLKGWGSVFGTSLLALRSFSITAAAATIAAAYLFAASASRSRTTGLVAAAAVAFSGWQIQFGWEARMYTLGTALALFSSWALLRALRAQPQRLGWWLLYAALGTAFIYTHYYALFTVAAQGIFVIAWLLLMTRGRVGELIQSKRVWYALTAAIVSFIAFLPWLPTFLRQNGQVQQSFWIGTINRWSVPDTLYRMWVPTAGYLAHDGWLHLLSDFTPLCGTILLLLILLLHLPRKQSSRDADWLVATLAVVPFFLSITLSLVSQSLYQDRFFIFAHVFILVAAALVLSRIPLRGVRRAGIALLLFGLLAGHLRYWHELDLAHKPGVHAATTHIYSSSFAEAPVIVSSPFVYFTVLHYAQEDFGVHSLPQLYSPTGELAHFAGGPILIPADVVGADIFTTPSSTLWVVDTTGFGGTPLEVPVPWHAADHKTYPEVFPHQGDVTVTRYVK